MAKGDSQVRPATHAAKLLETIRLFERNLESSMLNAGSRVNLRKPAKADQCWTHVP